jgi:hypothetical protein
MPKNNVTGQNRLGTQNTKIQKYKINKNKNENEKYTYAVLSKKI